MVMHARKQPRLSDGYADRKEAHLHQPLQYPAGGGNSGVLDRPQSSPFDRILTEGSPSQRISPRYQNKAVFTDRNKEKEKKNLVPMPDKRVNHQGLVSGTSSRGNGHTQGQGQGRYHDLADKGSASSSSAASKPMGRDQREHKAEQVQKYAVRVCGDWSEHISSSGKRYYYNCKTEVSQWEKPREWVEGEPDRIRDVKGHYRQSSSRSAEDPAKHSSSGDRNDRPRLNSADAGQYKPQERHPLLDKQRPFMHPSTSQGRDLTLNSSSMSSASAAQRTPNANHRSTPGDSGYSKESGLHPDLRKNSGYPYSAMEPGRKRPRMDSEGSRPLYPGQPSSSHHKPEGEHGGHGEDMDISPGSTPTSRNCSASLTPGTSCPASALQTLQKLQEALNMHIVRTQNNMGAQPPHNSHHHHPGHQQSPHSHPQSQPHPQSHPYPHQHPHPHPHQHPHPHRPPTSTPTSQPLLPYPSSASSTPTSAPSTSASMLHSTPQSAEPEERTGQESPVSEMSPGSCSGSPELSDGSSQNMALSTSALSGAAIKKEQSVELTPSLANYFNERLIGHVMGWQADYAERQAQKYREEALTTSGVHCSQVSVELKKARSLVRVAEIQATLHEQRLMFLDSQIEMMDTMKIPASFLPP